MDNNQNDFNQNQFDQGQPQFIGPEQPMINNQGPMPGQDFGPQMDQFNQPQPQNFAPQQPAMNNQGPMPGPNYGPQPNPMNNTPSNGYSSFGPSQNVEKKSNKTLFIVIGVLVVIAIVVGLIFFLKKGNDITKTDNSKNQSSFKKVLKCNHHGDLIGLVYDESWAFYINDGELAIDYSKVFHINEFHSSDLLTDEAKDTWALDKIEEMKSTCQNNDCTAKYNYVKGKELSAIASYTASQSKAIMGDGLSNLTADEIYTKLKTATESGQLDGSAYTCN